jgi:hypothetical protein
MWPKYLGFLKIGKYLTSNLGKSQVAVYELGHFCRYYNDNNRSPYLNRIHLQNKKRLKKEICFLMGLT